MLAPGTRLGPYEITAAVGAGGMGEVYRARDTRLDRTVAIKMLPAEFAENAQLRLRFEREARTISQLNHPHICALYDVGENYLVMEFLAGESLADRLVRGALPFEQVLRVGTEVADALDRAHRQGVVHRDVKPGNIILTKSGAKLVDFGLAKSGALLNGSDHTLHKPLTDEGAIIGTFHYMSPEQVEGREADSRSDIFSLGATLYEAATGVRPFGGKSKASVIAAILDRDPPPISSIRPMTPPAFDRLIRTCLAKDPEERWQSAHDVASELQWIRQSSGGSLAVSRTARLSRRAVWAIAGTGIGLLIGAAAALLSTRHDMARARTVRFAVSVPAAQPLRLSFANSLSISDDGERIAYRTQANAESFLAVRSTARFDAVVLPDTRNAGGFTLSPDGRWLAFSSGTALKKVSADGGSTVTLADLTFGSVGLDWHGDTIYYNRNFSGGIYAVSASGGPARLVIKPDPSKRQRAVVWPQMLPDGKTILATVWTGGRWDEANLSLFSLDSGQSRVIVDAATCGRYIESGHIVFGRDATLYAIPFDASALRTTGTPTAVVKGVASGSLNGEVHYAVARAGVLAYVPGGVVQEKRELLFVDRKGKESRVVPTERPYDSPAMSKNAAIAVTLETSTFDVWILDPNRDSINRVSFGGDDGVPFWLPDGQRVLWTSSRRGDGDIYWAPIDGSSAEEPLVASGVDEAASDVSPDGRFLLFNRTTPQTKVDLWVKPLTGSDGAERPFLATPFSEAWGSFSADGRWVVYRSDESGRNEIYVRPFPGPGGKWPVSVNGGTFATFMRNNREIVYRIGTKFFVVAIQTEPSFRAGKPQLLFEGDYLDHWSLGRNDNELMVVKRSAPNTSTQMHMVLNWFDELKRLAR